MFDDTYNYSIEGKAKVSKDVFHVGIVQVIGKFGPAFFILPERTPPCPWWLGQEADHNLGGDFSNPDLSFSHNLSYTRFTFSQT